MEKLPTEIQVYLLNFLSLPDLQSLLLTSKYWNWILTEVSLWRRLAKEDRGFPPKLFNNELQKTRTPNELYNRILRCRGTRWDSSGFDLDCDRPSIRGTSFCSEHCEKIGIPVCPFCNRSRASEPYSGCTECSHNIIRCNYIFRRGVANGAQCESPSLPGKTFCRNCLETKIPSIGVTGLPRPLWGPTDRNWVSMRSLYGYKGI
jgi:hypothetical protein